MTATTQMVRNRATPVAIFRKGPDIASCRNLASCSLTVLPVSTAWCPDPIRRDSLATGPADVASHVEQRCQLARRIVSPSNFRIPIEQRPVTESQFRNRPPVSFRCLRKSALLDEQHFLIGWQRPEVVRHEAFELVGDRADLVHGR